MSDDLRSELLRSYDPPECGDGPCRDHFMEFIYCVVIPCGVVLLLLVFLTWIMCCKACKCKRHKSVAPVDEVQLETYNAIRRASASLRHMSQHRDTALMGSRAGSMTLDRGHRRHPRNRDSCYSAPGTLQRQHRQRHAEYSANKDVMSTSVTSENVPVAWRSNRNRYSDQPCAPPPPPYSTVTDDVLVGAELLLSDKASAGPSVRYEPHGGVDSDGSSRPLLEYHRGMND